MRLLALLFALLFAVPAAAAPGLWVVRDGDTEISIFGTVHALPRDDPGLPPAVMVQLAAADTLVLETVLPEDRMALAPLLGKIGMRPGQKPLLQRVSKPAAARLAATIAHAGLPPFQMWVLRKKLSPATYIGTAALFFAIINWVKVPAYAALGQFTRENLFAALTLMPVAIASTFAGVALVRRVPAEGFYTAIYLLMIAVGGQLIWKALLG